LHNSFSAHGPDAVTFNKASAEELKPVYQGKTLAFMFESRYVFQPTQAAMESAALQRDYDSAWAGFESASIPK
jgi:homogentisate 1,2-dioxygenase